MISRQEAASRNRAGASCADAQRLGEQMLLSEISAATVKNRDLQAIYREFTGSHHSRFFDFGRARRDGDLRSGRRNKKPISGGGPDRRTTLIVPFLHTPNAKAAEGSTARSPHYPTFIYMRHPTLARRAGRRWVHVDKTQNK